MCDWEIILRLGHSLQVRQRKPGKAKWLAAVATGPVYRAAQYSPAGKRAGGNILMVGGGEDKLEETGGNSLEQLNKAKR